MPQFEGSMIELPPGAIGRLPRVPANGATQRPENSLTAALDQQEQLIGILQSRVADLFPRLQPVMRDAGPGQGGGTDAKRPPLPAYANRIVHHNEALAALLQSISDIHDRLDV